jgi:TolB-like protein/Tfp pilus assembly protein PilF
MSPEQVLGHQCDRRTDIFSVGTVLYEMATGRLPFSGSNSSETMDGILHNQPEAIARFNYSAPTELERMVRKCLEKDPEQRYQSARELLIDLKGLKRDTYPEAAAAGGLKKWQTVRVSQRMLLASVVLTLAVVGLTYLWKIRDRPAAIPVFTQSLAVLPLENLSRDPKQDFFSDGLTDALITDLAQIQTLRVISRTSVLQYKGARNKSLPEIAKELNVGAVLEGTVLWSGDRVRITAQLIEAGTDRHLWAKNYERDLRDILALQSEVSQAVAEEIRVQMTSAEKGRLTKFHPVKREAYEAYLRGMYGSEGNMQQFEKAIALDPDYAPAHAGLARFYFFSGLFGVLAPNVAFPKTRQLAQTALEKDETSAQGHACLALVKVYYDWDWREAEKEFRVALQLNPGDADVRHMYAHFLLAMNRLEESVAESKRAMELSPFDTILVTCVGWHSYYARQYDQTIEYCPKALAMDQNNGFAHSTMGRAYEQKSMAKEAIAALKKADDMVPLGHVYAVTGDRQHAEEVLAKLYENRKQGYFSAYNIAVIHQGLGNKDQAFEWLEKAFTERSADLVHINGDPRFDSLRSDARFRNLIKRIGLPS